METTLPLTTIRQTLPLATPQRLTPTGKSGRTDEAPRDPRRGASPRYAPTSRRPPDDLRAPQLDFSPWLFALIGRAPDVAPGSGLQRSPTVNSGQPLGPLS